MSSTAAAATNNGIHAPSISSAGRAQLNMSTAGRAADGARKQTASPINADQK
jgi:hypothetical protein